MDEDDEAISISLTLLVVLIALLALAIYEMDQKRDAAAVFLERFSFECSDTGLVVTSADDFCSGTTFSDLVYHPASTPDTSQES